MATATFARNGNSSRDAKKTKVGNLERVPTFGGDWFPVLGSNQRQADEQSAALADEQTGMGISTTNTGCFTL